MFYERTLSTNLENLERGLMLMENARQKFERTSIHNLLERFVKLEFITTVKEK